MAKPDYGMGTMNARDGEEAAAPTVRPLVTAHIVLLADKVLSSLSEGTAALAPSSHLCCSPDSAEGISEVLGMEHIEPSLRTRMLGDWGLPPGTVVASLGPWQHWESRPGKQTSLGSAAQEPNLSCEASHPSGHGKGQLALLLLGKQQFPVSPSSHPCPASRLKLGPPHPCPQSLAPETLDKPPPLAEALLEMLRGPLALPRLRVLEC